MRDVDCMLNDVERQYWMYAPGDKACHWEADVEDGVMGLDMDDIPDLRGLPAECIARKMSRHRRCGNRFAGVGKYAVRFCLDVQVGDIVFAKRGLHELLGVGVVTGDYLPLPLRDEGIHTHAVRWFVPAKPTRKSFNFGQPAFYAVKKNDPANIVALCPNCHRLMHFGTAAERTKALKAFYKARKDRLAAAGINITEERFVKLGLS